jgi:hypothetical protein
LILSSSGGLFQQQRMPLTLLRAFETERYDASP